MPLTSQIPQVCSAPILSKEARTEYRAAVWQNMLRAVAIEARDTVVELCPGQSEKVGRALARCQFEGRLFVIEPIRSLGQAIAKRYRELLPQAHIEHLPLSVQELTSNGLRGVDFVLSNHPLDDMLLAASIPQHKWSELWEHAYKNPEEAALRVHSCWKWLRAQEKKLLVAKQSVIEDLVKLRERLRPRNLLIYQYPSSTLAAHQLHSLDGVASELLSSLRRRIGAKHDCWNGAIRRIDQDPGHWLIAERSTRRYSPSASVPCAVSRLGHEMFMKVQAHIHPSREDSSLVVDPEFSALYGNGLISRYATFDLMAQAHRKRETESVFVDYQCDPSGVALGNDAGSGRAAYAGAHFNIKGIGRTPFVRSKSSSVHGTGRLNLMKGFWEMLLGNTVRRHFWCGGTAIVGLEFGRNTFRFKGEEWLVAKAVREDKGTLDRPTHLLQGSAKIRNFNIRQFARDLGRLDADQFTERILHNAWSPGNFSLAGQLIDFDTGSAVATRAPHFSYNAKYPAVLFGLEGEGKLMTLMLLREHCKNISEASDVLLLREFEEAKRAQLELGILRLLGISGPDQMVVRAALGAELSALTSIVTQSAGLIYPNLRALNLMSMERSPALFDYSKLFRFLPPFFHFYREQSQLLQRGFALVFREGSFERLESEKLSMRARGMLLKWNVILNHLDLASAKRNAIKCVELVLEILEGCERLTLTSTPLSRAIAAYRANEDRHYLMIGSMRRFLEDLDHRARDRKITALQLQELANVFFRANDRRIVPDRSTEYAVDLRIFREGYFERIVDRQGVVRDRFVWLSGNRSRVVPKGSLIVSGEAERCELKRVSERSFISKPYSMDKILERAGKESFSDRSELHCCGKSFELHSILNGG